MINEDLVPPPELLFDGTGSREAFIEGGPGFLWNLLVARARLETGHAVLDIGSGNGKHARVLAEFLNTSGRYDGFDIVPDGIAWCQRRYSRFPNFEFKLADVYSDWYNRESRVRPESYVFPYNDASFDVAFAASLFTHLEPDATANYLREAVRVLKPGGRILLTCFLARAELNMAGTQAVQERKFTRASATHFVLDPEAPSRGVAYDEQEMRRLVAGAGLCLAETTFGTWANGIDILGAYQDVVLAVKPK